MPEPWKTQDFLERFDAWVELENPSTDLRFHALRWVMARKVDPYEGVRLEPGFPDLWFGVVPDTRHGGDVVVCSYRIDPVNRMVACNQFGTLSWPV